MGIHFKTDQSGANNNICVTESLTFNFSLANNAILDYASFSIKKGSGTTASIIARVYDQANGAGNIVESVTVLAANVAQTFGDIIFTFSGNTTLTAGTSYSLKVTSSTLCTGNNPYSMKSGNFQVIDTTSGGVINTGYGIGANLVNNATMLATAESNYFIESNASSIVTLNSVATRTGNNNNNRKIKLDGNNIPVKIYLGGQKRTVYHGNRKVLDKND